MSPSTLTTFESTSNLFEYPSALPSGSFLPTPGPSRAPYPPTPVPTLPPGLQPTQGPSLPPSTPPTPAPSTVSPSLPSGSILPTPVYDDYFDDDTEDIESVIDILYVVTFRQMCHWTDQTFDACVLSENVKDQIASKVASLTAHVNTVFTSSLITATFNIVHIHIDDKANDESMNANVQDELDLVTTSGPVQALRDEYSADLVVHIFYLHQTSTVTHAEGQGWTRTKYPNRSLGYSSVGGSSAVVSHIYIYAL